MNRDFQTMKPVVDEICGRYSCRSFSDQPIPDEVLDSIIQAALASASGGNLQPISVITVRDQANKDNLCKLCEDQKFISDAAVNLVFCMDWHKYDRYTQYKKAPFVADHSFAHFMISMEDVMCMAQTVETVAYLYGIGSCYVGSVCNFIQPISQALKLPKGVFPVVLLSLGYPKKVPQNRVTKLKRDMIFCEESYTPYTDEEICQAFDEKYAGKKLPLPKNNPASAQQMLDTFYQCALTTYSKEEADAILAEIRENGSFNETQRRFGLHYEAAGILELGKQMQQELVAQGIDPFTQKKQ